MTIGSDPVPGFPVPDEHCFLEEKFSHRPDFVPADVARRSGMEFEKPLISLVFWLLAPPLLGILRRITTMIGALFNQTNYVAAKSMLDVTELRQQAIAANIANVETPGYKRLEVSKSFESQFEQALAAKDADGLRGLQPTLEVDDKALPSKRDGNTVRIEDELLAMSKNQIEQAMEARLVTGVLLKIRMAITGKS